MKEFHGGRRTRLYAIWIDMKARCLNQQNPAYQNYGGRGITVCDEWKHSFSRFRADMGEPAPGLTLERTDNDKGYSAGNCIWATRSQQGRNRRSTHLLTIDGVSRPMVEWAEIGGIAIKTLWTRISLGWDAKEAVYTGPVPQRERIARAKARQAMGVAV